MMIQNKPIILSTDSAEFNYEDERYRQNDPPFSAYTICHAYIPVMDFSAERVRQCLNKMVAMYYPDLTGIDVPKSVDDFTRDLQFSNSWRQLILEGLNGFLKLRMFPDTIERLGIPRGYVYINSMYLPKRGDIWDEPECDGTPCESVIIPIMNNLPNGLVIGLSCSCFDAPNLRNNISSATIYLQQETRFAVVISQRFVKDGQPVQITKAGEMEISSSYIKSRIKTLTESDLSALTHRQSADTIMPAKTDNGSLEVLSVYDPAALKSSPYYGITVGILDDAACAVLQRCYNKQKNKAIRYLIDKNGCQFRYDENVGKYCSAQGCELTDPENAAASPRICEPTLLFIN